MHIYKHFQSHVIIIIIRKHIFVVLVTIIRVSYNRNTINIQITVKNVWEYQI
jgi:hypothetical protein